MTRASIVQRLLDTELINAEEAVILLNDRPDTTYTFQPHRGADNYWFTTQTETIPPSFSSSSWEYPDTKFTPPTDN